MKDLPEACTEIENSLPLWVGGDLEPAAQKEVEDHLARCTRCSEKAAATRVSRTRLLQGLELERQEIGAGSDPWPAIRAALVAEGRLAGGPARRDFGPDVVRRAFPMRAAAAAAVLFGLVFAWTRFSSSPGPMPELSKNHVAPMKEPLGNVAPGTGNAPTGANVQTAGLRPLRPGERQLREGALFFEPNPYENGSPAGTSPYPGSPVGLEQPRRLQPR
jgi:hypothetical protein